jgi:hypothetical protein
MFLSVSHNEQNQKLTNIYVSNAEGKDFTLSLLNNVRSLSNGNCDFERIQGLHDVYIANFYEHQEVEKMKNRRTEDPELLEPYMRSVHELINSRPYLSTEQPHGIHYQLHRLTSMVTTSHVLESVHCTFEEEPNPTITHPIQCNRPLG